MNLYELQEVVKNRGVFSCLEEYRVVCLAFLELLEQSKPTRIISPTDHSYVFFQFSQEFGHKITRPLNAAIFNENSKNFNSDFEQFRDFLISLKHEETNISNNSKHQKFIESRGINRVIYTIQQSIGSISDLFEDSNQSRKRIGQLFENMILLIIKELGLKCDSRTIKVPLPNNPGYSMSYELDLVFSRNKAIVVSENALINPNEVVGSVKTTSKDRIDKVFLDKFLMSKLLGRSIPVIAIFLHDVQRAKKAGSIFGINSTFKSNHFMGYTLALNRLDGVYYVDPRPNMLSDKDLSNEIFDFSKFLISDLWALTSS